MFGKSNDGKGRGARRLLLGAGYAVSLAAVAALVSGTTYGLLSAASSSPAAASTAGTVTLTGNASGVCAVSGLLPTGAPSTCTMNVTYAGNAPAYLGLDVLIQTQAGAGGTKLYNPAGSGGLQVTISSGNPAVASYTAPSLPTTCPVDAPAASTCYGLNGQLVSLTPFTGASPAVTFSTVVSIPPSSPTGYQGGAAQIILTAHAAQSAANGAVAGCIPGQACPTLTWG